MFQIIFSWNLSLQIDDARREKLNFMLRVSKQSNLKDFERLIPLMFESTHKSEQTFSLTKLRKSGLKNADNVNIWL
jgi:hypothetical protein